MKFLIEEVLNLYINLSFKKQKIAHILLILALAAGAVTPIHEMARTIFYTSKGYTKIQSDLQGTNFFGMVENNKFLKYFGKTKN